MSVETPHFRPAVQTRENVHRVRNVTRVDARTRYRAASAAVRRTSARTASPIPSWLVPLVNPLINIGEGKTKDFVGAVGPLMQQIERLTKDRAAAFGTAVSAAFLSDDGREVVFTGPAWSADLNYEAAAFIVELRQKLGPQGLDEIDGGFIEKADALAATKGWRRVYP